LARLLEVYHESLGYNIVRRAEEAKVALSDQTAYRTGINLLSELIEVDVQRDEMIEAIESPKNKMTALVTEAVEQAGVKPDA
ncbi:molecular chaperone, partial [Escherichia coli]|nr:molecular chaperone [Escherichia coli]